MTSLPVGARLRLILAAFLLVLGALGLQVLRLQVVDPVATELAAGIGQPRVLTVDAPRGRIVDRDGRVLATNMPEYQLRLVPGELATDERARQRSLAAIEAASGVDYAALEEAVSSDLARLDPFTPVIVRERVPRNEAIALAAALADEPAAQVSARPYRVYEANDAFAHILGHVGALPPDEIDELVAQGYSFNGRIGVAGVEATYEPDLRGTSGRELVLADPTGRVLEDLGAVEPVPGGDIVLSIDAGLQVAVQAALKRGIDAGLSVVRHDTGQKRDDAAPSGAAVVMDVRTGELLALVSLPTFDPNLFTTGTPDAISAVLTDPARPLVDRTYMEVASPGSTFKPLVALAALEEGIATPSTRITSTGAISVQDEYNPAVRYVFKDWAVHGTLDLYQGIARSSDVYFYLLAGGYIQNGKQTFEGLGADRLARWARLAGFDRATGIDLPGETDGLVPDQAWKEKAVGQPWVLGDTYTFGIGQGYLTVTPLQMAVMTAALANGGELLEPRIVRGVQYRGHLALTQRRVTGRIPASQEHFAVVRKGMHDAAQPTGTASTGVPRGMTIGGKTGTAEFGLPYPDLEYDTHGWYIAFAPYEDPQVAVVVYLAYGVGSTHAGPVAREILEAYFGIDQPASTASR